VEIFLEHHWFSLLVAYFLYSAAVAGMPKPADVPAWGAGYAWVYTSSQVLAGNVDKIFGKYLTRFMANDPNPKA
jgi:hypothetical protein